MNKEEKLLEILYQFTKEFCKAYVVNTSQMGKMLSSALEAKQELKEKPLSALQKVYQDYIDSNGLKLWEDYSLRLRRVKGIAFRPFIAFYLYENFLSSPETAVNTALCLIRQTRARLNKYSPKSALDYRRVLLLNEN